MVDIVMPPNPDDENKKIAKPKLKQTEVIEHHHHHTEKIIEKPIDRVVEKEKIVKVPEIHTEALYTQLSEISSRVEATKQNVKDVVSQLKYLAQDPAKFERIEKLIEEATKTNTIKVDSVRSDLRNDLSVLSNAIVKVEQQTLNIKPPQPQKDYSQEISSIITLVDNVRKLLNDLNKLDDIKSYLTLLKQSFDKLNVNPVVNVTTQKIEDTNTIEKLGQLTQVVSKHYETFKGKTIEHSIKIDTVVATIQEIFPRIETLIKSISEQVELVQNYTPKVVVDQFIKSGFENTFLNKIGELLNSHRSEGNQFFQSFFSDSQKMYGELVDKSSQEFSTLINQKLFDLNIDLKSTIGSIVKEELNSYLKEIKIDTILPNDTLSFLSLIKESVDLVVKEAFKSKEEPQIFIVNTIKDLPTDYTNYKGRVILVKKVSFFKQNISYHCNGESWQSIN